MSRRWTLLVCRRVIKNKRAATGRILESGGRKFEQEETWQQKRSPDPAGAGPAVPMCRGEREPFFFTWGAVALFGEGWVEARVGFVFSPQVDMTRVFLVPCLFSMEHPSRGQQEMPWAPIALPRVLLQSTHAWCQGRPTTPVPFWSPASGHLLVTPNSAGL